MRRRWYVVALLVAAACGGGNAPAPAAQASVATPTATPTPTPSPSPTPSPVATSEAASSYFRAVPGFEWVTPPAEVQAAVVKAFSDPSMAPYFGGVPEARLVTQLGDPTSLLLLVLPLVPSYAALPNTLDSIVTGYGAAAPQVLTIGGRRAVLLVEDQKYTFKSLVWQQRAFVLWLYGFNGVPSERMTTLAQAVIAANQQ